MRWTKPCHEFDETARVLCDTQTNFYLWGTANIGKSMMRVCGEEINIIGVVDSARERQGDAFFDYVIESPDILKCDESYIIIVTTSKYREVKEELVKSGFIENVNFFDYFTFLQIYQMYRHNKLYSRRLDISLTEKCTLKCRKCNMFMPYFKNPKDLDVDDIKREIDNYFQLVDYLEGINLLGGEPFLYRHLADIITYIGVNYRKRIEHFRIFTNGMLLPNEELICAMREYDVEVQISDYTVEVAYQPRMNQLMHLLDKEGIRFYVQKSKYWGDFGFPEYPNDIPDDRLVSFFEGCKAPFRGLYKNRVYFCHLETSAIRAGLFDDNANDYFDLGQRDESSKLRFLEFDAGFSEVGAVTFCRKCRGCDTVNSLIVKAAEQM